MINFVKKEKKPLLKLNEWMEIVQGIDSICVVLTMRSWLFMGKCFKLHKLNHVLYVNNLEACSWLRCLLGWTLLRNFHEFNESIKTFSFFLSFNSFNGFDAKFHLTLVNICLHEPDLCLQCLDTFLIWLISKPFQWLPYHITYIISTGISSFNNNRKV